MKLDYTSLTSPVTASDIAAYKAIRPARSLNIQKWYQIAIIGIAPSVFIILMIIDWLSRQSVTIATFVKPFILALVLVIGGLTYSRYRLNRRVKVYRFARQNNLQLIEDSKDPGYAGMIFDEGHSRKINQGIVFSEGLELGNYEYVTGSGRRRMTHTFGYVKIPLKRSLPHMVLDGKANNTFGLTSMTDSFELSQKLSLEGDFDKHFTLYAPKEYERDALYVFTPDVMQVLIEEGKRFDLEIVDSELYIYSNVKFNLASKQQLSSLVKIIEMVGSELRDQTKRYADERVVGEQGSVVAAGGRRLNKDGDRALLLFLVVLLILLLWTIS